MSFIRGVIAIEYRIIDAHAHIWPDHLVDKIVNFLGDYYKVPMYDGGTYEKFIQSVDDAGVDKAVVFAVATKPTQVENINTFMASLPRERIIPFGSIHIDYENYKTEIMRMKELGLQGIKLHPDFQEYDIDDIRMMRIYEDIGDTMPILFHLGDEVSDHSSPKRLANVLDQLPYLRVIGAHFGGYQRWGEAMRYLVGRDIYLETSSSLPFISEQEAMMIINSHGADKFCFGTDYPMMLHKMELQNFMRLPLNEKQRRMILSENIERFLRL